MIFTICTSTETVNCCSMQQVVYIRFISGLAADNSRKAVREALRLLREDHLVSSRKGASTTVVPPRASDSYVHEVGWRKDSRCKRERRRWKYSAATDWLTAESRRLPSTPIRHPDFVIR